MKKWYATDRREYYKFAKWLDGGIIVCVRIYIVEVVRSCYECENETVVIGFGIEQWFDKCEEHPKLCDGYISICPIEANIPQPIASQLNHRYGFGKIYTKIRQDGYYGNRCCHCHAPQGNHYLFGEVDTPFFIDSKEKAEKLILHRIHLPCDICVSTSIWYGSDDSLIKKYAKIIDSDMQWNMELPPAGSLVNSKPVQDDAAQKAEEYEKQFKEFTKASEKAVRYENSSNVSNNRCRTVSTSAPNYYVTLQTYTAISWRSTLLLAVFLGFFGVHRIYVGKVGSGILYLFTFGLFGIGWLIDIISILDGSFRDCNGYRIRRR